MFRSRYYHFLTVFGVIFFLLISCIQIIPTKVDSVFLDKFVVNEDEITITFDSPGIDSISLAVEVPLNASIISASLDVTPTANNGKYPTDVMVNIGNDEDNEWEFRGTGYGSFGEQQLFKTGTDKQYLYFDNRSYRNDAGILLPRNATVKNTYMKIEGGTGTYDEDCFVAVDYYGYNIYYIKSNGDGTFQTPTSFDSNIGMYHYGATCTADFDNDGDLDVIASNGGSGDIYYYEKTGSGASFASRVTVGKISTSRYMYHFTAGDFTNDGNYDFLVSGSSSTISLFKGDGKGQFTITSISATGGPTLPWGKDAADINNDGNLDFVSGEGRWPNYRSLYYFEGNGDGTFKNAIQINSPSTTYTYSVITDDFNNDGNVDIITSYTGGMYYFKGNGDGTFGPSTYLMNPGSYPGGDAYDYDGDGNVDLMITQRATTSTAKYYQGNGDFTFNYISTPGNIGRYTWGGKAPPPKVKGAFDPKLNIGDTGQGYDWEYTGRLVGVTEEVGDFTSKLNNLLKSPTYKVTRDFFGNEFVSIPLNFTANKNKNGLIRVSEIMIGYDYTATIHQKGVNTIVDELNDFIVFSEGDMVQLHFIVSSSSAGTLKFSNLKVLYNIPPDIETFIPTLKVYEDIENLELLNLSEYFTDTDEPTVNLNYSVVKNTQAEHVDLFTNYTHTLKFRPITPNWYGEANIIVQVIDSGNKRAYSNEFTVQVIAQNDEPLKKIPVPDITLTEGEKYRVLDLELKEYFIDIEEDYLYYSMEIDPKGTLADEKKALKITKDDDNMVKISTVGDFNTYQGGIIDPVPVWIYCDDDVVMNTYADGPDNYSYQEILISVLPINDPPKWTDIPTVILHEDEEIERFENCMNIFDYLNDDETKRNNLKLKVISTNPLIGVKLNVTNSTHGYLSLEDVQPDYYGSTIVTITATDEEDKRSTTNFGLQIAPVNDPPKVTITSHTAYETVSGALHISGTMLDVEETIKLVEIKIESTTIEQTETERFDWQQAELDLLEQQWHYHWNSTMVPDGQYRIIARIYDGELGDETYVDIMINNRKNFDPVVEILSPDDEKNVNATIIISGTVMDPDNNGIKDLQIRIGTDMSWTDIPLNSENETLWSYTWDTTNMFDGDIIISVKAFDGDSWSVPATRLVFIDNGINASAGGSLKADESDEFGQIWYMVILFAVIMIIVCSLIALAIWKGGKKKISEYVPDGRMEPLDNLEVAVKPELGPGVSIEHAPLPAAPGTTTALPSLPAAVTSVTPITPQQLPPAQGVSPASGTSLPALPPAQSETTIPTSFRYTLAPVLPSPLEQRYAPAAAAPAAPTTKSALAAVAKPAKPV